MPSVSLLIVEDDVILRMDLCTRLIRLGYEVVGVAATGDEANKLLSRCRPDLVLMDICIEGEEDGIEVAHRIRSDLGLPIIFLTAFTDEENIQRAKLVEPHGYLTKPINEQDLRSTIEIALHKHKVEAALREREMWLSAAYRSVGAGVITVDAEGRILLMNGEAERMTGWTSAQGRGKPIGEVFRLVHERTGTKAENSVEKALREGQREGWHGEALVESKDGRHIPVDDVVTPIQSDSGELLGAILLFSDIHIRKQLEHEQAVLLARLQDATAEIQRLTGLIPICAACKKIRDDQGYWHSVEIYISQRSDANFTHGMCPECRAKYYPPIESLKPLATDDNEETPPKRIGTRASKRKPGSSKGGQ